MVIVIGATYVVPRVADRSPGLGAFANVPVAGAPNPVPAAIADPATVRAVASTVIVNALGCGVNLDNRGSGWPIGPHAIVTDAHVVGGSSSIGIELPNQPIHVATVVMFDARDDIALLSVPSATFSPLAIAAASPAPMSTGLFVGYPGSNGTNETDVIGSVGGLARISYNYPTNGAVHVTENFDAQGVGAGMSGGPIVDSAGAVVGMMQAAAYGTGQALPPTTLRSDLGAALSDTGGVADGSCDD